MINIDFLWGIIRTSRPWSNFACFFFKSSAAWPRSIQQPCFVFIGNLHGGRGVLTKPAWLAGLPGFQKAFNRSINSCSYSFPLRYCLEKIKTFVQIFWMLIFLRYIFGLRGLRGRAIFEAASKHLSA